MKRVRLSARLQALADLIEDGASVIDVGSDHGLLPVHLAQKGIAKKIIASDISAASLSAARRSGTTYGVTDDISFFVTPGLDGIKPTDVDTIVIAGMGGETIVSILQDALWVNRLSMNLILQPQSKRNILFRYLYNNEYDILKIIPVTDNKKQYIVIQVRGKEAI
ncbi:MAG: class I SAM-dependent methyltransferase [Oscillospiraceae bacterium]|nr:class I SAM-dependent methyltransferase [Oscillospiraceae bacterium]